jgi:outer membrane protein assembly factor BamB
MTNATIAVFAAVGVAALLVGINIIPYTEAALPITINLNVVGKQGPPGNSKLVGKYGHLHRGNGIFIGSDDGFLYCLDKEGKLLWKTKLNGKIRSSSPCLSYDEESPQYS